MKKAIALLALSFAACGGGESSANNDQIPSDAPTYHQDVKPVVDAYCGTCHRVGGVAPIPLENYDQVKAASSLIPDQINSRSMPPFLAAPAPRELQYDTSLSDEQIALINSWIESGMVEGDASEPGEAIELPVSELSQVDLTLSMPEPFTPTQQPDEYRCFVMEWPEADPKFITGFEFRPGNFRIDHHAAAFLIDAAFADVVDEADGADGKPGYPCFGAAVPPGAANFPTKLIAAWTPGGGAVEYPEGTGVRIGPGARIVLQMHYSLVGTQGEVDQSEVDFKLADSVDKNGGNLPWLDIAWPGSPETMLIPAGAQKVIHEHVADPTQSPIIGEFAPGVDPTEGLLLHSVLPHMHKLGKSFTLTVERADGSSEEIFKIANWDFDWQGYYTFKDPVEVLPGDQLRMTCEFDNSAENQPQVDGMQRTPQDVTWGDGTYDEMCTASIYTNGIGEGDSSCGDVGSIAADEGQFELTFDASAGIRGDERLEGELAGIVRGAVYRAEDVMLTGPVEGAEELISFEFEIDIRDGADGPFRLQDSLPAGDYQVLGYLDSDQNYDAANPGPDELDPVFIPVRAKTLACEVQPITLEFAVLRP